MSSHTNLPGSKAITSKALPQGTYRPDPMAAMHRDSPASQQSPDKTMKQLKIILNPAGAGASVMKKQQAIYSKGKC